MPTLARVQELIARVEARDYVQGIADFYHADASMQENDGPPRVGRDLLIAHEKRTLERFAMTTRKVERFAISGDTVFINWVFEMVGPDSTVRMLDEITVQTWRDDRIASEKFYYDPAQLR